MHDKDEEEVIPLSLCVDAGLRMPETARFVDNLLQYISNKS